MKSNSTMNCSNEMLEDNSMKIPNEKPIGYSVSSLMRKILRKTKDFLLVGTSVEFESYSNNLPKVGVVMEVGNSLQENKQEVFPIINYKQVNSTEIVMNQLSVQSETNVKTYQFGSCYNDKKRRWVKVKTPNQMPENNKNRQDKSSSGHNLLKTVASAFMLMLITAFSTTAQIDLRLGSKISPTSKPAIGSTVKYTVWVVNEGKSPAMQAITVKDVLPVGGVTYQSSSSTAGSYNSSTGVWTIPSMAVGDSVALEVSATVIGRGVFFNTAEVQSMGGGETDVDSTPGNGKIYEDDYTSTCFSVPILWYPGDEYTISVPNGYKGIQWFKGLSPIPTSGSTLGAVVNADTTLTIQSPGTYSFTELVSTCPASGCCAVEVIPGPYGSIGDFVWEDTNKDGLQTAGEKGIAGIVVQLYDATGTTVLQTTTTDALGKYFFDSLTDGSFKVKFVIPPTRTLTVANNPADDTKDSDAGINGFTHTILISLFKADGSVRDSLSDTLRTNPNIDAGILPLPAALGDFVWNDLNHNGIQDAGEPSVSGVKVTLLDAGGNPISTITTGPNGKYLFTNLPAGDYYVKFDSTSFPAGYTFTTPNIGAVDKNSDANPATGKTVKVTLVAGQTDTTWDAGIWKPAALGDYVWYDNDHNGIQDNTPVGVAGVTVYLLDASNNVIATTTTNANGKYLFTNLKPNNYYIKFDSTTFPAGYTYSLQNIGATNKDSDPNPTTGKTVLITLAAGQIDTTWDAGIYKPTLKIFDLAINKSLSSGQAAAVHAGDYVNYTVTVTNQGNVGATNIVVSDSLGTGLVLADANWTSVGNVATYNTTIASLAVGASTSITLRAQVLGTFTTGSITNYAQIKDAKDAQGNPVKDIDSTPGNGFNKGEDDDSHVPVNVSPTPVFDLAINKSLSSGQAAAVHAGDYVNYTITVTNQGNVGATNIVVSDSLGTGLVLADANWTSVGNVATYNTAIASLAVGASTSITLRAQVLGTFTTGSITNYAQIKDAKDAQGNPVKDIDSTPGNGFNKGEDDDSHVPVNVTPKTICATIASFLVTNGSICVGDTTYLKAISSDGSDINWYLTSTDGTVVLTAKSGVAYPIYPTTTITYYATLANVAADCPNPRRAIEVVVNARPSTPSCSGVIEACTGKMVDLTQYIYNLPSTPGGKFEWHTGISPNSPFVMNPTTVGAGTYFLFEKSGVGCYSNPMVVKVVVKSCDKIIDLSLTKVVDNASPNVGDNVTYTIKVSNAGPEIATNVEVRDVIPAGLSYVSGGTGLTLSHDTLTGKVASIAVGGSASFTFVAKVTGTGPITNKAEVSKADQKDNDSTPGNGNTTHEDDDDSVTIQPKKPADPIADLSLTKTASATDVNKGDQITYYIKVTNNGPDVATNVEVTDELPVGLDFVTANNGATISGGVVTAHIAQINVGETVEFKIVAKVTATDGSIVNMAQVSKSDQKDPDSTPGNGKTKHEDDDDSATIRIKNVCNPQTPIISCINPYICKDESITLTAFGCNGTVVWSDGQSGASISVSPAITTTYTAICVISETCKSSKSNQMTIVVTTGLPPVITASSTTICGGGKVTLTATGCASGVLTWSNGQTGNPIVVTPTVTTEYYASCVGSKCPTGKSNVIKVNISTSGKGPEISASNNTICVGGSITLKATGCAGTTIWSNGATGSAITITPDATTTYTAQCSAGDCMSEKSNAVTVTVTTAEIPAITATKDNVCSGEAVTLTATCSGAILWSNGKTTASITVNPITTSTYTATCSSGNCKGTGSKVITVTNKPDAPHVTCGTDKICLGDELTFTATGCAGTITWSNGQVGVSSIKVSPTTKTNYTATCTVNGCVSDASMDMFVTILTQTPVLTISNENVCSGGSTTLTATGCTGALTWSTGQVGTSITVNNITSAMTITATCTVESCVGKASKTVKVNGGGTISVTANKTNVCQSEAVILTATGCSGAITWSNGGTGSVITVTPTATTTYEAVCSGGLTGCGSKGSVTVKVGKPDAPHVTCGTDKICLGDELTFTATGCSGLITWSTGATGVSSIKVSPTTKTNYTATCTVDGCASDASMDMFVTILTQTPVLTISNENVCSGGSTTLTATGCTGSLTWSTGQIGTTITVNNITSDMTITAICTVESCVGKASKTVKVNGGGTISVTANKTSVCQSEAVILTATGCLGAITWSNGGTGSVITVTPTATTTYEAVCSGGLTGCGSKGSVTVKVGKPDAPHVTCGTDKICLGDELTFTATGCSGLITWSTGATGVSSIKVSPITKTNYTATCTVDGCASDASMDMFVTILTQTPVLTISNENVCSGGSTTLTATGCTGSLTWSTGQIGTTITVNNITSDMTITAICTVESCVGKASKTVKVSSGSKPTITSDKTTMCGGGNVVLKAVGCTGDILWSNNMTGSNIAVSPTTTTIYSAICSSSNACGNNKSNEITVTVGVIPDAPVITCSKTRICLGDDITLAALGCSGTVVWSSGQIAPSITVSPTETTVYTAICKVGDCTSAESAAATINVGNPIPPIVSCNLTQICGGTSTKLEAAGCTGTVVWSDGQTGAVISVTPDKMTSYSAICDGGKCHSEKSNVVTVSVIGSGIKKPLTKDLVNTCPNALVDLTTGVIGTASTTGGMFIFRTGTTSGSPAVTTPTGVTTTGTYYVFEKAGSGCYSDGAAINVVITSCGTATPDCATHPATAYAGKDTTICVSGNKYQLYGKIGGVASTATWTTDGSGSFDNALSLTAKYNCTAADITKGAITFTLTTNDPDGSGNCKAASSSFKLTLNGMKDKPTIQVSKSPILCLGDSVKLTANETATSYKWNNGATTKSIMVKLPGVYSVMLINSGGCSSVTSDGVTVTVGNAIATPTVTSPVKNNCPSTTVNLTTAVTSSVATTNGLFEYHTSSSPNSPIIGNASAMGAGTYYVSEKSTIGCYSQAVPIMVTIDNCTPTTAGNADVAVKIIASRSNVHVGDTLTYKITVTNNGPATATHVLISNHLPAGLITVGSTGALTQVGDSLATTIGSLAVGSTQTYQYVAKLTKAGLVQDVVKIISADQPDPITSNNISEADVECQTCQEACITLALKADTTKQSNGSYNIKFRVVANNCGNINLSGVEIDEDLGAMFTSPTTFTVIQKPSANSGSLLQTNDSYNGTTDKRITIDTGSQLAAAHTDTVTFVVNVVPSGNLGPFSTNAIGKGMGIATNFGNAVLDVSDVSTNGLNPVKGQADPTIVKFFSSPSIALTYKLLDSTKKSNGSYDLTYIAIVKNNGSVPLSGVQVTDSLSNTFKSPVTFTIVSTPAVNASSQLVPNNTYNGASITKIVTGGSMAVGKIDTITFIVNIVPAGSTGPFVSSTAAAGQGPANGSTQTVADKSTTSVTLGGQGSQSIQVPCIGVALYVKDTIKQTNGSYNIAYDVIVKNCGNLNLKNVQVVDSLNKAYTSPVTFTVVSNKLSAGSTLLLNSAFNGSSDPRLILGDSLSKIVPNKIDTIHFVINVVTNGQKGPFKTNSVATAKTPSGQTITDVSNDGIDPSPTGSTATVVNFNSLPSTLIGIAKNASSATKVKTDVYDVTYTLYVKNYGKTDLTKVQVTDDLGATFGDNVMIDSVNVKAENGFTVNSKYTGRGQLVNLLVDSTSTLAKNTTKTVTLFVRVNLANSTLKTFSNSALVKGTAADKSTSSDQSTTGINPDPDGDGNPANNSIPTKVVFDSTSVKPIVKTTLGIAKAAMFDSVANVDGSFNVTYTVVVKNYANRALTNVQLSDSLLKVFPTDSSGFAIIKNVAITSKGSKLKLDSTYNGTTNLNFFVAANSTLAKGASDTLTFKLKVLNKHQSDYEFKNSIFGSAKDSTSTVTDYSQTGLNPDKDGDGNPGNDNDPTVIKLKGSKVTADSLVIIPQGFSPNGDGINDTFLIKGLQGKPNVEVLIFNRYGHVIFRDEDYGRTGYNGWNGIATEGFLSNSTQAVPSGTYFYCVKAPDYNGGKPVYRYITVIQ